MLPEAEVTATDISAAALAVAGRNARRHGVDDRVTLVLGDLFEPIARCAAEIPPVQCCTPFTSPMQISRLTFMSIR